MTLIVKDDPLFFFLFAPILPISSSSFIGNGTLMILISELRLFLCECITSVGDEACRIAGLECTSEAKKQTTYTETLVTCHVPVIFVCLSKRCVHFPFLMLSD